MHPLGRVRYHGTDRDQTQMNDPGVGHPYLALELNYLHAHSTFTGVQLVLGTEPFNGSQLPLG